MISYWLFLLKVLKIKFFLYSFEFFNGRKKGGGTNFKKIVMNKR